MSARAEATTQPWAVRSDEMQANIGGSGLTPVGGFVRCLLQFDRKSARVVTAVRAGMVRPLLLVAVRALLEGGQAKRKVRAPLALAGMGDASLGNAHGR